MGGFLILKPQPKAAGSVEFVCVSGLTTGDDDSVVGEEEVALSSSFNREEPMTAEGSFSIEDSLTDIGASIV